jgi:hypothetical protein
MLRQEQLTEAYRIQSWKSQHQEHRPAYTSNQDATTFFYVMPAQMYVLAFRSPQSLSVHENSTLG